MDMEITCSGVNWVSQAQAEYLAGGLSGACKEQVEGDHTSLSLTLPSLRLTWRASALSWSLSKRKVWKTGVRAESHTWIRKEGRNSIMEGNWKWKWCNVNESESVPKRGMKVKMSHWEQKWKWISLKWEHCEQKWKCRLQKRREATTRCICCHSGFTQERKSWWLSTFNFTMVL